MTLSSISAPLGWYFHVCDMTHSCVWYGSACALHDSFMCVLWLTWWLFPVLQLPSPSIIIFSGSVLQYGTDCSTLQHTATHSSPPLVSSYSAKISIWIGHFEIVLFFDKKAFPRLHRRSGWLVLSVASGGSGNISIDVTRLIYVWKWDGSFSVSASFCCIFICVTALTLFQFRLSSAVCSYVLQHSFICVP